MRKQAKSNLNEIIFGIENSRVVPEYKKQRIIKSLKKCYFYEENILMPICRIINRIYHFRYREIKKDNKIWEYLYYIINLLSHKFGAGDEI